ncbi:uncharacterized protein B0H18DRAFT_975722 [Fomitopsis serialis]|uniref:uncharacterized protein n=1 Tax=Fomitopsis serialis TaxID=139415 RepID=UPI0020088C62|nr:uncharacterized protein B0H18DRAFT_1062568 [Neoantrodia serialis]XP_047899075.1 uncharacterized protein B0H18DRAFT_975722 [Neoantrodia serialis]KAH9911462.1 hypothetical protein B0H18DRAFT_1062568 [Neoantrodia serialis]KAH9935442.1 hypothetical protein B0H18DRAFT_975722 [Neoantrodia serialis]
MSYASVAAHNAPPPSEQPHPDQALFSTEPPSADNIADDAIKVNVVAPDFRSNPETTTSISGPPPVASGAPKSGHHGAKGKGKRYLHEAEEEGSYLYVRARQYIFQPGVAGGLLGLVNVGLISFAGYSFYTKPSLRRDTRAIGSAAAATLLLLTGEGYAAGKYRETPRGQEEEAKAKKEGAALYRYAREHILRPGVLGGLVGVVNAGVLGAIGYYAYTEWDRPRWDKRLVSAVSVGLLTLWSGEGYLAERYRETKH